MNFECYCHHTHPIIVESIGASSSSISKRVLQGNFPVMNAKSVAERYKLMFRITASSPDANCIENLFHAMKKKNFSKMLYSEILKRKHLNIYRTEW